MSDIIQLLPDAIINQVAAGEVIQRPASVVKELLENAIDAGASKVQLIVKDSGSSLIQVVDDGCGMSESDARRCFDRHATSKIRQAEDLFSVRTMGFRGEALAAIAAVGQVELRTRRHSEELGTCIQIEGSTIKAQEPCQCPPGTSISMRNIFFNLPARRRFLKKPPVEMRHITDEFVRVALANPDVFLSLHHNAAEVYHLPKAKRRQRIVQLFGQNYNERLVPVQTDTDIVQITGYIGKPRYAKKSRGEQFFFVNDRFIRSSHLHHAVMAAYEDLLASDQYPLYILFIDTDPDRIDVNVHPTKQQIKFEDDKLVYHYLKVAVRHALGEYSIMPTLDFEAEGTMAHLPLSARASQGQGAGHREEPAGRPTGGSTWNGGQGHSRSDRPNNNLQHWQKLYEGLEEESVAPAEGTAPPPLELPSELSDDPVDPENKQTEHKEPYQLHQTYIVSQIKSGFMLIDQQAAHERILYERYLQMLQSQQNYIQRQLFATELNLPPAEAAVLEVILEDLKRLGFEIRSLGAHRFEIKGLPAEFDRKQNEGVLIQQFIEQFQTDTELDAQHDQRLARALARAGAIRRGQVLSPVEMRSLIDRLFACELPYRSPFNRKCILTFKLDDLNRRFES